MKVRFWLTLGALASLATLGFGQGTASDAGPTVEAETAQTLADQADFWFDKGDYPRAIQALKMRHALLPTDYEAVTDLGWLLESTERVDEALAIYKRFRREAPTDPDSMLPEADYYFRKRLYAKVIPLLEGAITAKTHPNGFRMLAHSYERTGRLVDSQRIWTQYLKLHPGDEAAKNNLNRVTEKISKKQ